MFTGEPIELTTATFSRHVERSDLPLLVDFWAPWCGPCKMMAPQFQQAARQLEPRVRLAKVNTEAEPHLAAQFGIRSIPTLALFQGGREIGRQAGALGAQDIVRWAAPYAPFPPDIRAEADRLVITRTWQFLDGRALAGD